MEIARWPFARLGRRWEKNTEIYLRDTFCKVEIMSDGGL
jgi:hypothetical protein